MRSPIRQLAQLRRRLHLSGAAVPHRRLAAARKPSHVSVGDGGVVAVDDTSTPGVSYRYSSYYDLGDFRRQFFDTVTKRKVNVPVGLFAIGNGAALKPQFYTPIKLNEVDATRLIIGAANSVYESLDQGDTIEEIGPGIEVNGSAGNPIAYGGTGNPDMLYVGSGRNVYVRKEAAPAPLVASESYPGSSYVVGIAIDPANPQTAFVIDASNVYLTKDAGATWTKITGNLMTFDPVVLRSIAYATDVNGGSLFVGTNAGVFVAAAPDFSNWSRLGSGLPNAPVFRMEYNAADQILAAGTHGRGAWTLHFKKRPK